MELTGIAHQIWNDKYRYKDNNGEPIDITVEDTFKRVALALARAEDSDAKRERYSAEFYDAMADFSVIPAGRILAGAGTSRKVTLLNCYVMGEVPDSLPGIFDMLKYTAMSMKEGAGTGTDFSTLRPKGALIKDLGVEASGPLTFMDDWDSMCRSIMSAGHRRGAMMGTLRIDHPDIEAFIDSKRDGKRFRMFNISVLITDDFMEAVRLDQDWSLHFKGTIYKRVRARDLWNKIMDSTYECADPGVIFIDRVNATNPLRYAETLTCTNPCGEKPMPPWGSCCLGSINLTRMVADPFTASARILYEKLDRLTQTLVRMLDNVLSISHYPLEQQREESMRKRRIGVGVTGFADMLAMLGIKYSSEHAAKLISDIMANMYFAADEATQKLGEEKGSFPLYDQNLYGKIKPSSKYRRNSHLLSIAPTGTISLFAGNVSSGIEPIFDLSLKRRILQKDDTWQEVEIKDYAYDQWCRYVQAPSDSLVPEAFVTAADLQPKHHLAILAAAQRNVDSAISKTINCPESITREAFKDIYLEAYRLGAKSCTTYRPNKVTGSILSSDSMSVSGGQQMGNVVELTKPMVRPDVLDGKTYKLKPSNSEHALYITLTDAEIAGRLVPFEIFINTKNVEHMVWTTALTRMISAIFRKGGDVSFVVEELQAVFDPRGGYWDGGDHMPSVAAGIARIIKQHLEGLGLEQPRRFPANEHCPKCQTGVLVNLEGCWSCQSCTYSKCG